MIASGTIIIDGQTYRSRKKYRHLKHLQHIIRLQTSTSIQNSLTDIQYLIIRLAWLMVGTM